MKCWDCKKEIDEADHYCRHCGMGQGRYIPVSYRIPGIILWFIFTGPFALYYVMRTPFLGKKAKIAVSLIMTAIFCWFCYHAVSSFISAMKDVQQLLDMGLPPL